MWEIVRKFLYEYENRRAKKIRSEGRKKDINFINSHDIRRDERVS